MTGERHVGYGRPPREHRFRVGQSGNPLGRPKRQHIDIATRLNEPIACSINGVEQSKSPFEAGLLSTVGKAVKGNMSAARNFLRHCEQAGLFEHPEVIDDHEYRVIIPDECDPEEFVSMYMKYGPPPWPGECSGKPSAHG